MANKKATMTDLRLLIREFIKGTSKRKISEKLNLSRTSVDVYIGRIDASGKSAEELLHSDDKTLSQVMVRDSGHRNTDSEKLEELTPLLEDYARQMQLRNMTYQLLFENYSNRVAHPYGYTQFKEKLQAYEKAHSYSFHNVYEPAGEMQVDYAGDKLWIMDPRTKVCQEAYVLVCVLPFSSLAFAIAMLSTTMESFFNALSRCLAYFGGVPLTVKSDNMRQWVKKYDRYEPAFSEAANQWALHYGTCLENCRVSKPRDKGPAESLVNQVYRFYYSRIESGNGSGRREEFYSIDQLNNRLYELNDEYNSRVMKSIGTSRWDRYLSSEKPLMNPLPPDMYVFRYEKLFTVGATYHVQIGKEHHFYSIPYQYVGKKAKAVYDCNIVEVWVDMERVAVHRRSFTDGYTTEPSHMPPNHLAYMRSRECNAAYFLNKSRLIGPATHEVMQAVLKSPRFVQQSYKACHGILRLAAKFGNERLENACQRIGPVSSARYTRLKNILEHGLDSVPLQQGETSYMPANDDVRGPSAYT